MSKGVIGALALVVLALGLAACSDDDPDMANPASVYCEEQGGTPEIVTAADGSQSGICVLPDGTEVDEWEYYREGTGGVGLANPASEFCVEQGGTSEIVTAADGSQSGICVLPDGTEVDEWQYYRENAG